MLAADQLVASARGPLEADLFVGREQELEQIRSLVDGARTGSSRLLLIGGAAGSGRTELLRQCVPLLSDFQMLSATCEQSERTTSFGLAGRVIEQIPPAMRNGRPLLRLPVPRDVPAAELGLELLRVVLDATRRGPTALVVDDLQWVDEESAKALHFVLRRSVNTPLLTLVTVRTGGRSADLPEPLAEAPWRRVVAACDARKVVRLDGPASAQRRRLDELRRTLVDLPAPSRELLDSIVVLNVRCRLALPAQVSGVSDAVAALEPLLEAGLVRWWPSEPSSPVRMCDPMTRDRVYGLIGPQLRRDLHRAASTLVDRGASWRHRVAAAAGPDPELADELQIEAGTAAAEHDEEHAANLLLWAADLSTTRDAHERRLLSGMLHLLRCENGQPRVERLMPLVRACAPTSLRHCVQGEFALGKGRVDRAQHHLAEAVGIAMPDQTQVVARAAGALCAVFVAQGCGEEAVRHADIALAQPNVDPVTASMSRCGRVLGILYAHGPQAALGQLGTVLADPTLIACRSVCRLLAGNLVGGLADAVAADRRLRSDAVGAILVFARYLLGLWHDGWSVVETAKTAAPATGPAQLFLAPWHAAVSILASGRGAFDDAELELEKVTRLQWASTGRRSVSSAVAEASLAQAKGDYDAMVAACAPLTKNEVGEPRDDEARTWQAFWRPLHVEGLIGVGDLEAAAGGLDGLAESCGDLPYLRTTLGWLSGWLAERRQAPSQARACYEQALARPLEHNEIPLQRAHLERAYGRLLIRVGDRRQAINRLRRAQLRYLELGALPFANRCSADLAQVGLPRTTPHRDTEPQSLTKREREVSGLVARGMTNHEVAARLYVSQKTVEYHLSNVYAKLGIRSRRELRAHLASNRSPG